MFWLHVEYPVKWVLCFIWSPMSCHLYFYLGVHILQVLLELKVKCVFCLHLSWLCISLNLWQLHWILNLPVWTKEPKQVGLYLWCENNYTAVKNRWGCFRSHALKWNLEIWFITNFCLEVSNRSRSCERGCLLLLGLSVFAKPDCSTESQ